MAVPSWIGISGMLAAVNENLTVAVDVALKEDEDVRRRLQHAPRIGGDARYAGWQAVGLGIVSRLPRSHDLGSFGVERNSFAFRHSLRQVADRAATLPHAGKIRQAIG